MFKSCELVADLRTSLHFTANMHAYKITDRKMSKSTRSYNINISVKLWEQQTANKSQSLTH